MEVWDFVDFSLAVKLKEKGFYYECVATYDNDGILGYNYIQPTNIRAIGFDDCLCSHNVENDNCIDAPTISQVLKWMREEKNIHIEIWWLTHHTIKNLKGFQFVATPICENPQRETELVLYCDYKTAAIKGIEYVIDNLI